jgi:hypothetical protein
MYICFDALIAIRVYKCVVFLWVTALWNRENCFKRYGIRERLALAETSRGSLQFIQANAEYRLQYGPRSLPSTSHSAHYSSNDPNIRSDIVWGTDYKQNKRKHDAWSGHWASKMWRNSNPQCRSGIQDRFHHPYDEDRGTMLLRTGNG